MWKFWQIALLDIIVISVSYLIFRYSLKGEWRHRIWEKYLDSFAIFVVILFVITASVNIITFVVLNYLRVKQYVNIVAPAVVSILVGFILASVPQRGVEDSEAKKGIK